MIPKSWNRTIVAVTLISFLSLSIVQSTQACGPFFTDAIFVFTKHPDFPLERFAKGQLGVLQPSYARSYLVAAYRILIGEDLSDVEVSGLKSLWDERLSFGWESQDEEWIKAWNDVRAKVPGAGTAPEIRAYRNREKPNEYETYLNCQQDTFVTAAETLNERIKRFGADSADVRDWLKTQDVVFSNCGGGKQIPEPLSADQDALIRADRAYQIAAANFYAAQFDDATKQFDLIARDTSSPWRHLASYLAARSLLRKGSLAAKQDEGRPALAAAEARLQSVVNDKSLSRSHHAAGRLLNLVRLRLRPEEKVLELARAIVKRGSASDFKQTVWDYTVLLDKFVGDADEAKIDSVPPSVRVDDLSDWILTFQDESPAAANHALEQWQKTRSVAWLVASISKATGQTPGIKDLTNAAARVDRNAPAFASVMFHTVRLLTGANRIDEARRIVDDVTGNARAYLTPTALNLLLGQRMLLSRNLDEFLHNAQRVPAGFSDNNDGREIPDDQSTSEAAGREKVFFDVDAARVFNDFMPETMLEDAGRSTVLAANLRRDVAQAAFMRAALIDDRVNGDQAATTLASVYPELKELLAAYQRATTPDARRFAAAYLALKFPGLRPHVTAGVGRTTALAEIDSYRDNWWCAEAASSLSGGVEDAKEGQKNRLRTPEFLKSFQSQATSEAAALRALGTGPNYLSQTAISWGTKNPNDARVPEALHLAVKSTRYGLHRQRHGPMVEGGFRSASSPLSELVLGERNQVLVQGLIGH
jgi:hypothetical protein